jgi:hypothetical protein
MASPAICHVQISRSLSLISTNDSTHHHFHSRFPTDDPYYCGLRARVPNFVKATSNIINTSNKSNNNKNSNNKSSNRIVDSNSNYISSNNLNRLMKEKEQHKKMSVVAPMSAFQQMHGNTRDLYHHQPPPPPSSQQQYSMWHAKSYESGIGETHF